MRERCPKCRAEMSDEELRSGTCFLCDEVVLPPQQTQEPAAETKKPESTANRSLVGIILSGIAIALLVCVITPIGVLVYLVSTRGPIAQKDPEELPVKKSPIVVAKKSDVPEKKKPIDPPDEPKKEEKAKPKDEPKKEEPKIVEPAPKYPAPILVAANRRLASFRHVADGAIKIDGDLSEWKEIAPLDVRVVQRGKLTKKPVAAPKSQKAWIAYDSRGLLIAADIVDTSGVIENLAKPAKGAWAFWDNDAIEIYLDTLNLRAASRGEANAHQFFAFPLGVPDDAGIGGYESRCLRNAWTVVSHANTGKDAMLRAGKKTADGWSIEILIPNAALRHAEIKPGAIFGFEMQIDTGTNIYYFWANEDPDIRVSTSPFTWGEAIFGGADATIDLDAIALIPGEPLALRLTDADRNANPQERETIEVSVVSKSGDRKQMKLEETAPNSGVFIGSIATRLATGKREPNVLEILAGEEIVVEYLDPLRANGDRNVVQRVPFSVRP